MSVRRDRAGGDALRVALEGLDGVRGKTGYFETSKYSDGTSIAYVATIQEFGDPASNIPARPTMRPTAADKGKPGGEWSQFYAKGAKAVLAGTHTAPQVMEMLALRAAGDVSKAISELMTPTLSPVTLMARLYRSDTGTKVSGGKTLGALAKGLDAGPVNFGGIVSTKPLVDTGAMIAAVTGVVEVKGGL